MCNYLPHIRLGGEIVAPVRPLALLLVFYIISSLVNVYLMLPFYQRIQPWFLSVQLPSRIPTRPTSALPTPFQQFAFSLRTSLLCNRYESDSTYLQTPFQSFSSIFPVFWKRIILVTHHPLRSKIKTKEKVVICIHPISK